MRQGFLTPGGLSDKCEKSNWRAIELVDDRTGGRSNWRAIELAGDRTGGRSNWRTIELTHNLSHSKVFAFTHNPAGESIPRRESESRLKPTEKSH